MPATHSTAPFDAGQAAAFRALGGALILIRVARPRPQEAGP
jgi:hypothetical protein